MQPSDSNSQNRVMIVDRSHLLWEVVSRQLQRAMKEIQVTTCSTGKEALEHLEKQQYQLITTSLMLPDMDGFDLCRKVRSSSGHRFTPVVVISSDAESRSIKAGFDAGVTDYFDKSRGLSDFAEFIADFVRSNVGLVGRVLYLEDSASEARSVGEQLNRQGLKYTHLNKAEDAYELLDEIRAGNRDEVYDLVIADYHLAGEMTGGDLLHALRSRLHFTHQELPMLIMTGDTDPHAQAELLLAGANDFVNKPVVEEVLISRIRSLLLIKHQFEALRRQAERMAELAITDMLTGVRNRTWLAEYGPAFFDDANNAPLWVLLLDIDFFKKINDTHGHDVGDKVLSALGKLMSEHFPECAIARYGGEEFAVLLPKAETTRAMRMLERLRAKVEQLKPNDVSITISTGAVSKSEYAGETLEELLNKADEALYEAKETGRNRSVIYTANGLQSPLEVIGFALDQAELERTAIVPGGLSNATS